MIDVFHKTRVSGVIGRLIAQTYVCSLNPAIRSSYLGPRASKLLMTKVIGLKINRSSRGGTLQRVFDGLKAWMG